MESPYFDLSRPPAASLRLCESVLASFSARRSARPVPPVYEQVCERGAPTRPFLASPSPTAFHRSAAASFHGTRLRAAFSSLRREEPDRRYCRERGHAYALLRRRSKRIG